MDAYTLRHWGRCVLSSCTNWSKYANISNSAGFCTPHHIFCSLYLDFLQFFRYISRFLVLELLVVLLLLTLTLLCMSELVLVRIPFGVFLFLFISTLWMDDVDYNVVRLIDRHKKTSSKRNKINPKIACVAHILCTNVQH